MSNAPRYRPDRRRGHRAQGYEDARAVVLLGAKPGISRTPPYVFPDRWGERYPRLRALDALDYIDGAWEFLRIADRA